MSISNLHKYTICKQSSIVLRQIINETKLNLQKKKIILTINLITLESAKHTRNVAKKGNYLLHMLFYESANQYVQSADYKTAKNLLSKLCFKCTDF